jgi:hypothetical protein
LAPIFTGSGIKNKVAEPLWHGISVITTQNGANGLRKNDNLIIAKSPVDFAAAIKLIQGNRLTKIQTNIYQLDQTAKLLELLNYI